MEYARPLTCRRPGGVKMAGSGRSWGRGGRMREVDYEPRWKRAQREAGAPAALPTATSETVARSGHPTEEEPLDASFHSSYRTAQADLVGAIWPPEPNHPEAVAAFASGQKALNDEDNPERAIQAFDE